ncbi:hypothetical protein OHA74_20855 [Streptomyces phaeochromogenes]|uniref:hypothetical protein n=1 Tax=Streptomyces phaeochromogenes TaxID=1923 RepID=UPI002E2A50C1|nr:hypothetical protein [Streptomyces phaeochromogenes]
MMNNEQLKVIEGELDATIDHLLINRQVDVDLVIIALDRAASTLAECVAGLDEQ